MTLVAWRTGITLRHCDESLFRIMGEIRQTDALSGEILRRLPFWGFWLDFLADTVASSHRKILCRFLEVPGPVPRSGRHRERRKPVHLGLVSTPYRHLRPMSEKRTGKATGRANHSGGGEKYAPEMETTENHQWQGRRFTVSRHQI